MTVYGPLIGVENVRLAIVDLLRTPPSGGDAPLLVYYLAEVERQNGLKAQTLPAPPNTDSYYAGADFESWDEGSLPSIIVMSEPTGTAERHERGTYGQWFESQIAAVIRGDDEDQAQTFAAHYGTAIEGAILQRGSLGGIATKTNLVSSADVELLTDPASRVFARSVVKVQSYIQPLVVEYDGPGVWPSSPYVEPSDRPVVAKTAVTFTKLP